MSRLSRDQQLERLRDTQRRRNNVTGGYNVKVTNGSSDTSWITVPGHVGEVILRLLESATLERTR